MVNLEFFGQRCYGLIDEVCPLITHQCSWTSKSSYYILNKKCAIVSTLQSITGVASSHRVRYFVVVMMYLAPDLLVGGLIGPMKSMAHLSKTCNVTCGFNGISSLLEGFLTL
jgi:hypothetical protein